MGISSIFDNEYSSIQLPNCVLYPHQKSAWTKFNGLLAEETRGVKLMILEWHRRCGKDILLICLLAKEAVKRAGNYYYIFPEKRQAREAIFEGIDADGRRLLDYIPYQLIHRIKEQEMVIYIKTNKKNSDGSPVYSTIQLVGSDANTKVGTSIRGAVFSEYALCNPAIWFYLEPALGKTNGFAGFISTPRGEDNHMVKMIEANRNNPQAFIWEQMTIKDSSDYAGNRIFTDEDYEKKRLAGIPEETLRQEYYCDRVTASAGSYYSLQFQMLYDNGRMLEEIPLDRNLPLHFGIDLGVSDRTVIWVGQKIGGKLNILDYYCNSGLPIEHYIKWIGDYADKAQGGYIWFPHDIQQVNRETGRSTLQTALKYISRFRRLNYRIIPKTPSIIEDINEVRRILNSTYWNMRRCYTGVQFLKKYRKKTPVRSATGEQGTYDDNGSKPHHDEASDYADGLRYLLFGMQRY